MRHKIILAPEVDKTLQKMRAYDRKAVLDAIEDHLRHDPRKVSRSRIKALRDLRHPQYRLLVGAQRVFYDVVEDSVNVLAVVSKAEAASWLALWGVPLDEGGESP